MNKREFIKNAAILGSGALISNHILAKSDMINGNFENVFTLPPLPYSYDALEPFFDKMTMEIHHDKHHQAYVTNLNKAVNGTDAEKLEIEEIIKNISKYPVAVRNNGGGHYNHTFFWSILAPNAGGKPTGKLASAIDKKFGTFDTFKDEFGKTALSRFGSGWAWLIMNQNGDLAIVSTPNQDNTLMDIAEVKGLPILALDVWEHAYYLKYQNKRADYIAAFWNVVNWKKVSENFEKALK